MQSSDDYARQASQFARMENAPVVDAILSATAAIEHVASAIEALTELNEIVSTGEWSVDALVGTMTEETVLVPEPVAGGFDEDCETLELVKPGSIVDTARGDLFVKTETGKWIQIPALEEPSYLRSIELVAWQVRIIWEA